MMYAPASSDFDALAYGNPHPGTLTYIRQKFDTLSTTLTDVGAQFMADARSKWNEFMGSDALRRARAVKEKLLGGMYLRNEVQTYSGIGQFQSATPMMQNLIMSEPSVRQMFYDQRIDGYSGSYVDPNPGLIGWDDPVYRSVMNGVAVDDKEHDFHIRVVLDDLPEGVAKLAIDQISNALNTFATARSFIEAGMEDITSLTGGWM